MIGAGSGGTRRRARRGACRRARAALRREPGLRRKPSSATRRDDRRRRRRRLGRGDRAWSSRRIPTSRCCRARPPSATTTATSSACSSASPITWQRLRHPCRGSGCGRCARSRSCSRRRARARIAYANNDLPGTMLAGAARTYVERYAVRPGSRAVVFTNNDSAYATALALHGAGVAVAAIVDARSGIGLDGALPHAARDGGPADRREVRDRRRARRDCASRRSTSRRSAGGAAQRIDCDLVGVSGGWNPAVHLFSQARGKLRYDDALATLRARRLAVADHAGRGGERALRSRRGAGRRSRRGPRGRRARGLPRRCRLAAPQAAPVASGPLRPLWCVPARDERRQALRRSARTTSPSTTSRSPRAKATGRSSISSATPRSAWAPTRASCPTSSASRCWRQSSDCRSRKVGTTTFRPPYTPVTLGAFPGHDDGRARRADALTRRCTTGTSAHGARFVNAGLWKRPHSYPRAGESADDAANREAKNVRTNVGIVDVSTLGKIELQGRDVAEFLNRVYINRWDTLAVGPLPLRRDAARRRHGVRRRHHVAPRAIALPDDDDHGERRQGDAAPRHAAAGRLAGARRLRDVGDRAMGGRRAVGPSRAPRAREDRRHRRVERGLPVSRGRRLPGAHRHRPRLRRGSSG